MKSSGSKLVPLNLQPGIHGRNKPTSTPQAAWMRRLLATTGLLALACSRSEAGRSDSAAAAVPHPDAVPVTLTVADFQKLRWINGPWRGFRADGSRFYEWYRFLDDSTLHKTSHADSTFGAPAEESHIMLRNGIVVDSSARMSWVATRWDSSGADFVPRRGATSSFTWAREDSTKWNATIRWTDRNGQPRTTLYALHRFGR